jgi:hypothetical protein
MRPSTLLTVLASMARTVDEARCLGFSCGLDGPNATNCHLSLFTTPELTKAWEEGKRKGEAEAQRRDRRPKR